MQNIYDNIAQNQQYQGTAFTIKNSAETTTYKTNIKRIYSIINQSSLKLAKFFQQISQYQNNFENQLL